MPGENIVSNSHLVPVGKLSTIPPTMPDFVAYYLHTKRTAMSFIQTREMLAKLFATENLVVEHDSTAITASFDTDTRVLTLPVFKTEDKHVYNMLVAHESSHALHTPPDWAEQAPPNVPFDYINVIEDVRIERLIQAQYPGLRTDFTRGYDELNAKDFFGIAESGTDTLSLIDRINLHFKLGARALIRFTDEELTYVNAVDEADTYDKVLLVATMLHDYIQSKKQGSEEMESITQEGEGENDSEGQQQQQQSSGSNSDETDDTGVGADEGGVDPEADLDAPDEEVSRTQEQFDKNAEQLSDNRDYHNQVVYAIPSELPLDEIIIPLKTLRSTTSFHPSVYSEHIVEDFNSFMTGIKRDVNFMVQQFEMRKSANAYARTQEHKTGVLNTNMLHNYKLTDDVFLRQNITPDGKSHGMVMLIDWSGSMENILLSTVKQVIVLAQFCRKASIPFDVYLFTSGGSIGYDEGQPKGVITMAQTMLVNVLSSSAKRSEMEIDIKNLYLAAACRNSDFMSHYYCLGGTPLNAVLTVMPRIIADFKRRTGAQKVNFTCLTDGESSPLRFSNGKNGFDYAYYQRTLLRDGFKVIDLGHMAENSGRLAHWIGQLPDVTVTNIFLGTQRACLNYIRPFNISMSEIEFRKQGATSMTTDEYWGLIACINPKSFGDTQDELCVESGASKAKIRTALKKMLCSKQSSKVLLTQLVSQIS